mmetsp:Transcript_17637/g.49901  ORF Transcript_17637/g.49901 Transcript_17637/m.49901 type:complete len:351 (+) Transcript_17637:291-1343(+)
MNIADTTYSIAMCIIIPSMYIRSGVADVPSMVTHLEEVCVFAPFVVTGICLYTSYYRFMHKTNLGVDHLRKSMRLQHIMFFTSRLSLKEFNAFINGLEDHDQHVLWQAMNILYNRLLKWQAGPGISQQAIIPDADCYHIVNNTDMLNNMFDVAIKEERDHHIFHEHSVLQHVYESILRSCMARGICLKGDTHKRCEQIFRMLDQDGHGVLRIQDFIQGAVGSSLEITEDEATEAFQLMDVDGSGVLSKQEVCQSFVGLCTDPLDPALAEERRLMRKLSFWLQSASNASAKDDAALRVGRQFRLRHAALRIQRVFRRSRSGPHTNIDVSDDITALKPSPRVTPGGPVRIAL